MRCWCGYLSGAMCRLFAYSPADATASQNPVILPHLIQTGFTLLVPTYPGCPRKEAVKLVCVFYCNNSCYIFLYKHVFSLFICYYDEQK